MSTKFQTSAKITFKYPDTLRQMTNDIQSHMCRVRSKYMYRVHRMMTFFCELRNCDAFPLIILSYSYLLYCFYVKSNQIAQIHKNILVGKKEQESCWSSYYLLIPLCNWKKKMFHYCVYIQHAKTISLPFKFFFCFSWHSKNLYEYSIQLYKNIQCIKTKEKKKYFVILLWYYSMSAAGYKSE